MAPTDLVHYQSTFGGAVWPQIACRPMVMQFTLQDPPTPLGMLRPFQEALALPPHQRQALYEDPEWRDRSRSEAMAAWRAHWPRTTIQESRAFCDVNDVSLAELAARSGTTPFDLMLDASISEGLHTRFRVVLQNDDEKAIAGLLADKRTLLGLSDAGAHASQLCDACYSTYLLEHWVRERGVLSLEEALATHGPNRPRSSASVIVGSFARGTRRIWSHSIPMPSAWNRWSGFTTSRQMPTGSSLEVRGLRLCGSMARRPGRAESGWRGRIPEY